MTTPQAPDIRRPIAQRLQAMGLFDHAAVPPSQPQVTVMEKPRTLSILTFILLIGLLGSLIAFTHLKQPDWLSQLHTVKVTALAGIQSAWAQVSHAVPKTTAYTLPVALPPPPAPELAATQDNSPVALPPPAPVAAPVPPAAEITAAVPVVSAAPTTIPVVSSPPVVTPAPPAPLPTIAPPSSPPTPVPAVPAPTLVVAPSAPTAYQPPAYYYPPHPYYYAPPPPAYYYPPHYYQPAAPAPAK